MDHTRKRSKTPASSPMQRLWAPWRIGFVGKKKRGGCIFCKGARAAPGGQTVYKSAHSLVMLNIYPYNNGHIMVSPLRHTADLATLSAEELLDMCRTVVLMQQILRKTVKPHGFNIGMNVSTDGGAGIADHLHIHIVPRWRGDTNFMPILAGTKVISQSLEELSALLIEQLKNHAPYANAKPGKKIRR